MRPPVETRVAVATDALKTLCDDIASVAVFDGPQPATPTDNDVLIIGIGDDGTRGAAAETFGVTAERMPGLAVSYDETILVACALWSWTGGPDLKPSRDRCVQVLGQLRVSLDTSGKLGGICDDLYLHRRQSWLQMSRENGVAVQLRFWVAVRAMI